MDIEAIRVPHEMWGLELPLNIKIFQKYFAGVIFVQRNYYKKWPTENPN